MRSLENIIKNIEQTIEIHKWNKGLEELPDGENIELNVLIEKWELKIQYHSILFKSQQEDLSNSKKTSGIKFKLLYALSR